VNFNRIELVIPVVFIAIVMMTLFTRKDAQIKKIIKDNWLLKETPMLRLRQAILYLGFFLVFISLLDLRGPVEQIEGSVPDQKTLIIVDSSSSMFVEDVRPNRYKKALILARHFVKQAVAHQVSIVLFSDIQKRLVPFTDDIDFLISRISALENDGLAGGGSNITQALEESLGYFKTSNENENENEKVKGNILILTDSEGHDGLLNKELPKGINVAVVGIGTLRGGRIPIRDKKGVFRSYKKFKGKEVVSKLNEKWIKDLGKQIPSFKYWIANSYALPTNEIVNFFRKGFVEGLSQGNVSIKPVWAHYLIIPGLLMIIVGYGSYFFTRFVPLAMALFMLNANVKASDKKQMPLSDEVIDIGKDFRRGELNERETLYYAQELVKNKRFKMASTIFSELERSLDAKDLNNYGVSLLGEKKITKALKKLQQAEKKVESIDKKLAFEIKKNILRALKMKEEQKKNKKSKKDKKDQDKKDKKKDENKKEEGKKGQEGKDKEEEKEKEKEKKKKGSSGKEKKEEDKKENKNNEKKDKAKKTPQQQLREKEQKQKLKRKMKKVPGIIKQIMSDDRRLQKKYLDTSTKNKNNVDLKDW